MSIVARRFVFGLAVLFCAGATRADVTGTWSGTYSETTRCSNGSTRTESGPISLSLTQTGNDVSGLATIEIVNVNFQCTQTEDRFTVSLPLWGSFVGSTLALKLLPPETDEDPFISITAMVNGNTMSLSWDGTGSSGSGALTRTSTQGAGPLTGTYSGSFLMKPVCPNGAFTETGTLSFVLNHGNSQLAGIGDAQSSRHVDIRTDGTCFDHDVVKRQPLMLMAEVSGTRILGLILTVGGDEIDDHEEDITEIEFSGTASGTTITGTARTAEYEFSFTMSRTSSTLAPRVLAFEADPEVIAPGQTATLSWQTFNASSVSIDRGIGAKPSSGSVTVTPPATTTYTLSATGAGGTATATTTVEVRSGPPPPSGACNLSMTLSCPPLAIGVPTVCSAVTVNQSSQACSGTFTTGFFSDAAPSSATFSGYNSGLGLPQCFSNGTTQGDGIFAYCKGQTTLAPGGQFTQMVTITPAAGAPPLFPISARTIVADPVTGAVHSQAAVVDEIAIPGCVPSVSAPAVAQSGGDYVVSWTATRDPNTTFTLEESTNAEFTANVNSFTVTALQRTFRHDVAASTTYYYRVRPNNCQGGNGAFSATASTVVQAPPPVQTTQADVIVPFGSREPFNFQFFVPGLPGVTANFTARTDQPFLTVTPSSGTVPPAGRTISVTANPTDLPPGANTGTLTVVVTAPGANGPATQNGSQTITAPVSISLVTPVTPGGKNEPPPNSLIIPVVTHVNGANGPFLSDVRLVNTTGALTRYQLLFTPTQSDGTKTGKVTEVTAANGQTLALNDVVKDFFGFGATGLASDVGFGVLEIRPMRTSSLRTFASSRTYIRTAKGTLGQFIAAVPYTKFAGRTPAVPGSAPRPTPVLSLQHVAQSAKFRTNVGIVEGSGAAASGRYRLYDAPGALLSEVSWSLQAGEHRQMNAFISTIMGISNLEDGRIEILVDSSEGAVTAYASVLDNKTDDPMAVMPVDASGIRSRRYTIPGMAEFGGSNNFHSDVRVYNGGSTAVTVTPAFYAINDPSNTRTATPFTVAAGEMKVFDNVLPTLFGSGVTGGSVVFTTAQDSSLVVTGRTYTIDPAGGTFGQFIPGVMPFEGLAAGGPPLELLQLEQSAQYRTNVGLAEVAGEPAKVRMTFSLPDTKTSAIMEVDLAANHYTQFGRVIESVFGPGNYYNVRISIEVVGGNGRVAGYGSVLDSSTQDPTYVPAQ